MAWDEGQYQGKVVSLKLGSSSKKGTPLVEVEVEIQGHRKRVQWYLTGATEQYTIEKLRRIRADLSTEPPTFSDDDFDWTCKHEDYNGKPQEKWDLAAGSGIKPMDDDRRRLLIAKLGSTQPGKPATPPPAPKPAASKPPSRPPSKPSPAKPKFADSDAAWAELVRLYGEPSEKEWNRVIAAVESKVGREQDAFTADDWTAVVDGYIPL